MKFVEQSTNSTCEYCGSNKNCSLFPKTGQVLCRKHRNHIKNFGEVLENSISDPNTIIIKKNFAVIILRNAKGKEVARSLIDLSDVKKVSKYKWCMTSHGYVKNTEVGYLHRFIMNVIEREIYVDHKNNYPLINRKFNLRSCTPQQNSLNSKLKNTNTSGIKGVHWNKNRSRWISQICNKGITINLGSYVSIEDAIEARKEAEDKYFGEFKYQT